MASCPRMHDLSESISCDICPSGGRALFSCQDCRQKFCEICLTYHQKFEGTHDHTVCQIPYTDRTEASTTCPIHKLNFEYRCIDDHMNCCAECKKNCHNNCNTVKHFKHYISEKDSIKNDCDKIIAGLKKKKEEANRCHKLLNQNTENWKQRIHEKLTEMKSAMEDLEVKMQQKIASLQDFMTRRQIEKDKIVKSYDNALQDLTGKCLKLTTAEKLRTESVIIIAIQDMDEVLQKHKALIYGNPCDGHTIALVKEEHKFEAEHYVEGTLEKMMSTASEINNIYKEMQRNKLQIVTTDNSDPSQRNSGGDFKCCDQDVRMRSRRLSEREKVEHYQSLVHIKEAESAPNISVESMMIMNGHLPDDTEQCAITGIAELKNGEIIIADFQNKKLKLLDEAGNILDYKTTEMEPRDIAVIDKNNVMVSIPKAKCIQFVEIYQDKTSRKRSLTLAKTYDVDGKCCGIAYQNGKIYTATQMPTQILILDISGNKLSSISGEDRFERPTYTVVPPGSSLIYMSDPNHKYVYGLTENGKIAFKYKVDGPHGISYNENSELFIADFDTSSIHLVSKSGTKIGVLAPENCHCPQKVSYNTITRQLLVTMWNADIFYKFKLSEITEQ